MKKLLCLLLILTIMLFCSSCKKETVVPKTEPPKADNTQEEIIEEKHSEFYLEGYSVDEVLQYFNEVVLKTEYSTGSGDASLVQRWDVTISYRIEGDFTEQDCTILREFFAKLNEIEGFAGASEATEHEVPNLYISFDNREVFDNKYYEFLQGEYADGATRYWYYTETNDIYEGTIGYCTDMPAEVRESVLLEEIVNCLGVSDTALREDSIVYQYSSSATSLSEIDWLIMKLLYNPRIRCGMDARECEEVIRELYY